MAWPSRQGLAVCTALALACVLAWALTAQSENRVTTLAFWFEPVTYDASEALVDRLGGPIAGPELDVIKAIAVSEVSAAFTGLRVTTSTSRDASYRVRVVQDLRNPRNPRYPGPAGSSRAVRGLGGQGEVSFRLLANHAISYAPTEADRDAVIAAIGRGVGRAAVHELAHQLLVGTDIHASRDIESYEYRSADRRQQYYGALHWGLAWPLLQARLGPVR